jgi:hypothetical protein
MVSGMPAPGFHALSVFQSVLDFANAKLAVANYVKIVKLIPLGDLTFAGDSVIRLKAAEQLQECIRRALDRLVKDNDNPLRASLTTSNPDFLVNARLPFGLVNGRPVPIHVGEHGTHPAANDLQDMWFLQLSHLINAQRRYANLPPSKRLMGWTDRVPPAGSGGVVPSAFRVSFRPVALCAGPTCGPPARFFFRKRAGDRTCGSERCRQALDYKQHKNERRRTSPKAPHDPR